MLTHISADSGAGKRPDVRYDATVGLKAQDILAFVLQDTFEILFEEVA